MSGNQNLLNAFTITKEKFKMDFPGNFCGHLLHACYDQRYPLRFLRTSATCRLPKIFLEISADICYMQQVRC